ncbi:MAG: glycerate kinase [Chloroflexota bacterium]|nr:glycerate kinase [Chloroflexota bacterium]
MPTKANSLTMRILIAPGAFKGSLSHLQAAAAIEAGLRRSGLYADYDILPLADGGDGTLDALLASGGQRVTVDTFDALSRPIKADYGRLDEQTAVIEMAQASGLAQLNPHALDALHASTYGTGVLMQAALAAGARRFIIGLGGSATTDAGSGALQALGVHFSDAQGHALIPGGGALSQLAHIDTRALDPRWREAEIIIATDVDNPALGERGAAHVFAPQKGASPQDVEALEASLSHFFEQVVQQVGVDVRAVPGGGAAGAFAAGLLAFIGGRIQSGVDLVLEHHRADERLAGVQLVITGEGKPDGQTMGGKAPLGIARRASARGIPTVAIVGGLLADDAALHAAGIWAALPITPHPMTLDEAVIDAAQLVERAATRLGYLLQVRR